MSDSVSLIIPTKNRPSDLELTVASILQQSVLPDQIIIVDQGHSDESDRQVEKLFAEASLSVREKVRLCYIRDTIIPGAAVARNRAMEIAQGDIWLFLDDDVLLEPDFLEELLDVYQQHPDASGVSGIISNYQPPSLAYWLWASIFVRGPFHDERQPIYWRADRLHNAEPVAVRKLGGGLMSFRARAISGVRFDENLCGVSDGEDVDFCTRLGPNATLLIAPRARLAHKGSPIGRAQDHWLRRFAQANHYLYHRDWRCGIGNRLSFAWLNLGMGLVATIASVRRASLAPWRALLEGARDGSRVASAILLALEKTDGHRYQHAGARGRLETLTDPGASARVFDEVLDRVAGGGIVFKSGHPTLRILTTHPKGFHGTWSARTDLLPGWLDEANRTQGRALSPWRSLYWGWKLFRTSTDFDVVVTGFERSWHLFALLQGVLRRRRVPHVLVYFFCGRFERPLERMLKRWYYRLIARACARIVVYSRRQIDLYAEALHLPREKFACVPYHTTLDGYHSAVCADMYSTSDGDYIFSGGDFKDYATLLQAVRELPCRTIIATRDKQYFRGLEIPENVEVATTSHEQFFRLMAGAKLFVLPLRGGVLHPGGEQSYLNAMAMGKPVVVAADFGADEYITHGVSGLIVPTGQASALRDVLLGVLENQSAARDMGRAAKQAAAEYSPERFIRGVLAVIEECVRDSEQNGS